MFDLTPHEPPAVSGQMLVPEPQSLLPLLSSPECLHSKSSAPAACLPCRMAKTHPCIGSSSNLRSVCSSSSGPGSLGLSRQDTSAAASALLAALEKLVEPEQGALLMPQQQDAQVCLLNQVVCFMSRGMAELKGCVFGGVTWLGPRQPACVRLGPAR
eukprot:29023-Pelagomonas_calceolata.AAC.2